MPWCVFASLFWLVKQEPGYDFCIPGLCPSVEDATPPPSTVSTAQGGRQELTFFSGSHPHTIAPCEFLLDLHNPSSNVFLPGRSPSYHPTCAVTIARTPCEFLLDIGDLPSNAFPSGCRPSYHPTCAVTIARRMFLLDVSCVILIDYAQPSYCNTRPRYDDPAISDDETDHADLPKLSEEDLTDWQHTIGALVDKSFTLSAPGVEEASTALLNLLTRLVNDTPASECLPKPNFQVAGGACCTINHVDQLVYPLPPFIM